MTETLLSLSSIFLFGRRVEDVVVRPPSATLEKVKAASTEDVARNGLTEIDDVKVKNGDPVLLTAEGNGSENGIYIVRAGPWESQPLPEVGSLVRVKRGEKNKGWWVRKPNSNGTVVFEKSGRGGRLQLGQNSFLEKQLDLDDASLARIYGFSYEGTYFELARPTIFLVHGEGDLAAGVLTKLNEVRGPIGSTTTGIAASDFQFAAELRVWCYDKSDYTIRMDVETGMFEDVLLAPFFGGDGYGISGAKVSGAKVSGAKVSGARIAGAKISGAKLSGARGDASD